MGDFVIFVGTRMSAGVSPSLVAITPGEEQLKSSLRA
jgi:hypothetical protein